MIIQVDPNAASNLSLKLASMQETGELCDFAMVVGGSEIKAHKCILAASCEYFRTSFRFSESSQAVSSVDLSHLDCSVTVVEKVVRSFYTNELDLDACTVESVLKLVDYFMCDDLKQCIEVFMEKSLGFSNAVLYFQLCLQYQLTHTKLFHNAQCLLWYRFHDYFIYHPVTQDISLDVIKAFGEFKMFHFCSPLQILEHLMNNLKSTLLKGLDPGSKEEKASGFVDKRIDETFDILSTFFQGTELNMMDKWRPYLLQFLTNWKTDNLVEEGGFPQLFHQLKLLESQLQRGKSFIHSNVPDSMHTNTLDASDQLKTMFASDVNTSNISTASTSQERVDSLELSTTMPQSSLSTPGMISHNYVQNNTYYKTDDHVDTHCEETPHFSCNKTSSSCTTKGAGNSDKEVESVEIDSWSDQCRALKNDCEVLKSDTSCDILVLLAPTAEMSSQVNAVEAGRSWPLLNSPQLELRFYDTQLKVWRQAPRLEFPVPGVMMEKHAWRMAFFKNSVYLFSLVKKMGIEYDVTQQKWETLDCGELFVPHGSNSPVKSIIPVAVGEKLIVLSLSREAQVEGTYWTQQDFYQLDCDTKKFQLVATVRDERMDLPITQWTVYGNTLITVKASTMMFKRLSRIQYIHVFNSDTSQLKTHNAVCAMESGMKVLAREKTIYLLDKEGWCRSFNLDSSQWTGLNRFNHPNQARSFIGPYNSESVYPALTRVTCHAGSSRWEVTTTHNSCNAYMQETRVSQEGIITVDNHPPPPFAFFTAMTSGKMLRSLLDCMKQAQFEYSESKNV